MLLSGVKTFFYYKFPLKAEDFNKYLSMISPGVVEGLEVRKSTGALAVKINKGSLLVLDSNTYLTNLPQVVKINVDDDNSNVVTTPGGSKTRLVVWYSYALTAVSNQLNVAFIDPLTELQPYHISLCDVIISGSTIVNIDYSTRDYSFINSDALNQIFPNIGIRYKNDDQVKLVYNSRPLYNKYKFESITNVSLVSGDYCSNIPGSTYNPWNTAPQSDKKYLAFLILDSNGKVFLKFFLESDAGYNSATGLFDGDGGSPNTLRDYPFHKFIGEFWTSSGSGFPIIEESFYDSYLDCQHGDVRMFSGLSAPIGWQVCDGTNGSPDLQAKFIVGVDPRTPSVYAGGTTYAKNDVVSSGGLYYISLQDGNIGNTPLTSPALWTKWELGYNAARFEGGENTHVLTEAELASHDHIHHHTADLDNNNGGSDIVRAGNAVGYGNFHTGNNTSAIIGSDDPHENRPLFYSLFYAIKY